MAAVTNIFQIPGSVRAACRPSVCQHWRHSGGQLFTGLIHIVQPVHNLFWSLTANMNLHVVKLPSFFEVVFVLFWVGNSLGAPWSKHLGEQFPWKSIWGKKFVSRHLYSGCFTMSPSSITSLPPSLPSLAKSWSVEIFSFNFSPYLSVGKVEIHLFFAAFFNFYSIVCWFYQKEKTVHAWGSNLRADAEYPCQTDAGAAAGRRQR